MKKIFLLVLPAAIFFAACSKDENKPDNPPASGDYINTAAGSMWSYRSVETSDGETTTDTYTLTSTNKDTSINNRKYHVYTYSYGGNSYMSKSGNDYYSYEEADEIGLGVFERLFLRTDLDKGGTWSQSVTINVEGLEVPVKLNNKIADKNISREVEGKKYEKVIHVVTTVSFAPLPVNITTNLESYYAPGYGLIEGNNEISGDILGESISAKSKVTLMQAQLK